MNTLKELFGEGEQLTPLQMSLRAIALFIITLVLIRIAGRRAFGLRMPFDNVLAMLIGAVLSRAITGASPFVGTVAAAATIVALYRLFGWISLHSHNFGKLLKGETKVLYKDGVLHPEIARKHLVSQKDMMEGVRIRGAVEDLDKVKAIYLERDGQISVIKKE